MVAKSALAAETGQYYGDETCYKIHLPAMTPCSPGILNNVARRNTNKPAALALFVM